MGTDLQSVLLTKEEIDAKLVELAAKIDAEYAGKDLLIVGVLKGAVMVMADLARALSTPVTMDWMAVSSYGAGTQSSGVVRILKDLDTDIKGKHVLIVEDIIDSGLTLSWLLTNLGSREPASLEVCTLLRKPDAAKVAIDVKWVGFDIPNEFVVGYGLDYAEKYRNLPFVGTLAPTSTAVEVTAPAGPGRTRPDSREPSWCSRRWSLRGRVCHTSPAVTGDNAGVPSEAHSFLTAAFTYGQEGRGDFAPYGWT